MALASGMKDLVNSIKATRKSRNAFVKGNRENAARLSEENRNYLKQVHEQNKNLAEQTAMFIKSSKESREASFKATMDQVHADIDRVHQAKEAIVQGAREMMKEFHEDSTLGHQYWMQVTGDKPVGEVEATVPAPKKVPAVKKASPTASQKAGATTNQEPDNQEPEANSQEILKPAAHKETAKKAEAVAETAQAADQPPAENKSQPLVPISTNLNQPDEKASEPKKEVVAEPAENKANTNNQLNKNSTPSESPDRA